MFDPQLAALAAQAGQTIVQAMASDGWAAIRDRLVRLVGGDDEDRRRHEADQLEATRAAVHNGQIDRNAVAGRWQGRLEALLENDPGLAEALAAVLEEARRAAPPTPQQVGRDSVAQTNGIAIAGAASGAKVHQGDRKTEVRTGGLLAVVGIIAALLVVGGGAGVVILTQNGGSGGQAAFSTPTPGPAPTSDVYVPPTEDPVTTEPEPTDPNSVVGTVLSSPVDLDPSEAITYNSCGYGWDRTTARIANKEYLTSISFTCSGNGRTADIDFLVPNGAKMLTGVVGIEDHSPNATAQVRFSVLDVGRNQLVPSRTLSYGQSWTIGVPVNGVGRIRLQIEVVSTDGDRLTASWAVMRFEP